MPDVLSGKNHTVLIVGGIVVLLVIAYVLSRGSTTVANVVPPNYSALDQANSALQIAHQNDVFSAFGALTQYEAEVAQTKGAVQIAGINAQAQEQQSQNQVAIAQLAEIAQTNQNNDALRAAQYQAQAQANAANAQANSSWWSGLFGSLGSIGGLVTSIASLFPPAVATAAPVLLA